MQGVSYFTFKLNLPPIAIHIAPPSLISLSTYDNQNINVQPTTTCAHCGSLTQTHMVDTHIDVPSNGLHKNNSFVSDEDDKNIINNDVNLLQSPLSPISDITIKDDMSDLFDEMNQEELQNFIQQYIANTTFGDISEIVAYLKGDIKEEYIQID